jgi:hypothetical protein
VTAGGDQPQFRGVEYPSLENSQASDPYAPVDYPADPGLPPPVYRQPYHPGATGYPGYPGGYPPPPAPYSGYPADPYDPYRPMKPPGTNGKAIGALITSVVGLIFCGLPSIAGIILGVIAMRETRRTGQDGYGLALAAVIIGGLVLALIVAYIVIVAVIAAGSMTYSNY